MPDTMSAVQVPAPAPAPRTYATAMTTYVAPVGPPWDTEANGAKRWLAGVTFTPFGCQQLQGRQMDNWCDPSPTPARTPNLVVPGEDDCVTFEAFQIDTIIENKIVSGLMPAEVEAFLVLHSTLARSIVLAREVQKAVLAPGNPSLVSEADTVTGLDTTAIGALSAVEDALGTKLQGGVGMVHMTPGMLTILNSGGGLQFDGSTYRTPTGHVVVADAGYTNMAPGAGTLVAGEAWIYGSGPVFAKLDNVVTFGPLEQAFDLASNTVTARVHQLALAMFEPCSVVAAKVEDVVFGE